MAAEECVEALQMGLNNRIYKNTLLHHSGKGFQYCSNQYVGLMLHNNIAITISENGDPYENAFA